MLATRLGTARVKATPANNRKLSRYMRKVSSSSSETWRGRRRNGCGRAAADPLGIMRGSERDVAVLAARGPHLLTLEGVERRDQPRAGLSRLDDVVDVAALSREVGVGELLDVVLDQLPG